MSGQALVRLTQRQDYQFDIHFGDEMPEIQFEVRRRLAPGIHARFESSLARGGGGRVHGPMGRKPSRHAEAVQPRPRH